MSIYASTLYVWDHVNKQIISIPKTPPNKNILLDDESTKRMLVVDDHYGNDCPSSRYGCYLFTDDNRLIGFWEPKTFKNFPLDFRANLLLLGVE